MRSKKAEPPKKPSPKPDKPKPETTKEKKRTVFLDMDGVLVDFIGGVARLFGTTREELEKTWPPGTYEMHVPLGLPSSAPIWDKIATIGWEFWADLEPLPWADELVTLARSEGRRMFILSSPSHIPSAAMGKTWWLKRHFGSDFRDYILTSKKELLANEASILIDDDAQNGLNFRDGGGDAICFPQIWNVNNFRTYRRMEHVAETLERWEASLRGERDDPNPSWTAPRAFELEELNQKWMDGEDPDLLVLVRQRFRLTDNWTEVLYRGKGDSWVRLDRNPLISKHAIKALQKIWEKALTARGSEAKISIA